MVSSIFLSVATLAVLLTPVLAHPSHDLTQEIAERNSFLQFSKRASNCDIALRKRGIESKSSERRRAGIQKARVARGLPQSMSSLFPLYE